jgi:hypothetical protein
MPFTSFLITEMMKAFLSACRRPHSTPITLPPCCFFPVGMEHYCQQMLYAPYKSPLQSTIQVEKTYSVFANKIILHHIISFAKVVRPSTLSLSLPMDFQKGLCGPHSKVECSWMKRPSTFRCRNQVWEAYPPLQPHHDLLDPRCLRHHHHHRHCTQINYKINNDTSTKFDTRFLSYITTQSTEKFKHTKSRFKDPLRKPWLWLLVLYMNFHTLLFS